MPRSAILFRLAAMATPGFLGGPEAASTTEGHQALERLQRIAWSSGTWQVESPARFAREAWGVPAGGVMLGIGPDSCIAGVGGDLALIHSRHEC